jgi:hypothetical protein
MNGEYNMHQIIYNEVSLTTVFNKSLFVLFFEKKYPAEIKKKGTAILDIPWVIVNEKLDVGVIVCIIITKNAMTILM